MNNYLMDNYKSPICHSGGKKRFKDASVPNSVDEARELVKRYIQHKFDETEVADEIVSDRMEKFKGKLTDDEEDGLLFSSEGRIVATGAFVYQAKNHSVQTIWKNKFEIRERNGSVIVNVSDSFGPTVDSWQNYEP